VRIVIIGNAGAGKTTLARRLAREHGLERLALDDLVWSAERRRLMRDPSRVRQELRTFAERPRWVIEGVYTAHLQSILHRATRLIWLDVDPTLCARRVRSRGLPQEGWRDDAEKAARLDYVERWAREYGERDGSDGRAGHRRMFEGFGGEKERVGGDGGGRL